MLTRLPHHLGVILPVLVHVETHLDGDLSTPALAALAGLSPAHFSRVFAAVTGETVKQYTLRVRLERAAYRLLVEPVSAMQVAADSGFGSHEVFTRAFRRRFGVRRRPTAPATRSAWPRPSGRRAWRSGWTAASCPRPGCASCTRRTSRSSGTSARTTRSTAVPGRRCGGGRTGAACRRAG